MAETTPRLGLPLLAAGQAQKEVTHNEALALVDALAQPCVETMLLSAPPTDPATGQAWIVGADASGAWANHAGDIAIRSEGGWRFVRPVEGMTAWIRDVGLVARHAGGSWSAGIAAVAQVRVQGVQVVGPRAPAIAEAIGGATVDVQGRAAIAAILSALRNHGLIAT